MAAAKQISLEIIKKHNKAEDLWIVIEDKVYDVTKFITEHPGGEDSLIDVAGRDATKDFIEVGHSSEARELMQKFYIGDLAESDRKRNLPKRLVKKVDTLLLKVIKIVYIDRETIFLQLLDIKCNKSRVK